MKPEMPPIADAGDSYDRINDTFYERGWTDGLPIVPPTEVRVQAMLAGMSWRDAEETIAIVPPRMGVASMRQIAVNAVMAGARPEYLPVIVAALQAVSEPEYGLSHRQTSTHAGAPLLILTTLRRPTGQSSAPRMPSCVTAERAVMNTSSPSELASATRSLDNSSKNSKASASFDTPTMSES